MGWVDFGKDFSRYFTKLKLERDNVAKITFGSLPTALKLMEYGMS